MSIKHGIVAVISLVAACSPLLAQTNLVSPPARDVAPSNQVPAVTGIRLDLAPPQSPAEAPFPKGLRVFVCGHSFHTFIWYSLWEMASAVTGQFEPRWHPQFLGGSTVLQHWDLPDERNEAKQLLTKGEVDVLTLAPGPFPDPGIENFVKLGLEHNPKMRFTVQLSWGGFDDDNQKRSGVSHHPDVNKTPAQLRALAEPNIKAGEEQIAKLNQQIGRRVVFLVPMAQAVVALRTRIYNHQMPGLERQDQLFQDAIGHPTAPLQALNAYLHYAVIYRRSPVGFGKINPLMNAPKPAWDDKFNRALQELAWETVTNYPFSGVTVATETKQRD